MTAEQRLHDHSHELVPLNAVFATDFVQILVLVSPTDTMRDVAAEVARHVEGRRVRAQPYDKVVTFRGEHLPEDLTVAAAGLGPRDHIAVDYDVPEPR